MGAFTDLFTQLDPDRRVRGAQFERITKWFLESDPYYQSLFERVWPWKEWPARWSDTEAGIDLVAKDRDGLLWAIQCKAYAVDRRIPKSELNKFLSESNRKEFQHRLLVSTTTRGLHHIAQGTVDGQDKPVAIIDLEYLATSPVDWPTDPAALSPSKPLKPAKPRDYQRAAIKDVVKGFKTADRGQLIMACGTGKTLTSLFIKETLRAQRALVLVPSLSLLKQTMRVWYANKTAEFDSLPVCSDDTVRRYDDAAVTHVSDLGMPVTTDPYKIAAFLRKRGPRVLFATYQSSPRIAAAFDVGRVPAFDLVIADEAHRCAGPVSSDFATILDGTQIKAHKRLFMTATPRYFTGRVIKAAKEADFEYASMDDESKFGTVFHRLGFSDAIQRGLLTDYQVAIIGVDDATYKDWAERGRLVTLDGRTPTNARTLAGQIGLAKAMRKYNLRRTISFHSRVSSAKRFAESMPGVLAWMPTRRRHPGRFWAEHASGEMSAGERYRLLQRLSDVAEGEWGLLANARCLGEGVDVPTLDGVAFIDPRGSEVDIVQAVGRAIRKTDDKTMGTIVIPVFISNDEAPEAVLDSSAFKPIWDVIKALRAHDDELGRELDEIRRSMGRRRVTQRLPGKIKVDLPSNIGPQFESAIQVRLVERTTAPWEYWYGLMEKYIGEHGNADPPTDYVCGIDRLGQWVGVQRSERVAGILSPDRERRLSALPDWTWDARLARWETGWSLLLDHVRTNGTADVPVDTIWAGFELGKWARKQRGYYNRGQLGEDRRDRLEALPGWSWNLRDMRWRQYYDSLRTYVENEGTSRVPQNLVADGLPLGQWLDRQRSVFANGKLPADRVRLLEKLTDWSWKPRDEIWDVGYNHMVDYARKRRTARIRVDAVHNGFNLGWWARNQRNFYSREALDRDRIDRLEALPGWEWRLRAPNRRTN